MYKLGKTIKAQIPKATETDFYGSGWAVHDCCGNYEASFLEAKQGGGSVRFKITQSEYLKIREGSLEFNELMRKYHQ